MKAHNLDEVVERMQGLREELEWRDKLTERERRQQPILVVYIEEFLSVKRQLRLRAQLNVVGSQLKSTLASAPLLG